MAKVEGSNPFIRFRQNPQNPRISGGFVRVGSEDDHPTRLVGTTNGYQTKPQTLQLRRSLRRRSELAQAVQRLPLELAAALLFDPEPVTDFLVTLRGASAQAVATHQHLAVAFGQQPQQCPGFAASLSLGRTLSGIDAMGISDQIAERGCVFAYGFVE